MIEDQGWSSPRKTGGRRKAWIAVLVALILLGGLGYGAYVGINYLSKKASLIEGCYAYVGDREVLLTHEQAVNAAIISGVAMREEMGTRGAVVALATAYQESGLRNLDYGDRDSVGLFQQRPSMGWGSVEQIMDPVYSTQRFLAALTKVPDWKTGDVNDVAQKVQKSGFPEAYRKHVTKAELLGSVLTGQEAGAFSCLTHNDKRPVDASIVTNAINSTWGVQAKATSPTSITLKANNVATGWSWAYQAIATMRSSGVSKVTVGTHQWEDSTDAYKTWMAPTPPAKLAPPVSIVISLGE